MIYVLGIKDEKVLAYDGACYNAIYRIFGTVKEKIAQGIIAIYLRAARETDELMLGGYDEYYVVSVRETSLSRAVARTCLAAKERGGTLTTSGGLQNLTCTYSGEGNITRVVDWYNRQTDTLNDGYAARTRLILDWSK